MSTCGKEQEELLTYCLAFSGNVISKESTSTGWEDDEPARMEDALVVNALRPALCRSSSVFLTILVTS